MNPAELFSFRQARWFENIVGVAFIVALMATGFTVVALINGSSSVLQQVCFFGAILIMVVGTAVAIGFADRYESERRNAIFKQLESLGTPDLVALSGSPEVNQSNRNLVVAFLNTHRQGWSFAIDTVNTTTA